MESVRYRTLAAIAYIHMTLHMTHVICSTNVEIRVATWSKSGTTHSNGLQCSYHQIPPTLSETNRSKHNVYMYMYCVHTLHITHAHVHGTGHITHAHVHVSHAHIAHMYCVKQTLCNNSYKCSINNDCGTTAVRELIHMKTTKKSCQLMRWSACRRPQMRVHFSDVFIQRQMT